AIASAFGLNADRLVCGAFLGRSDWLSTATTCGPAPMANRSSVPVELSETIRAGRLVSVTRPAPVVSVTGKALVAVAACPVAASWSARTNPAVSGASFLVDIRKPPLSAEGGGSAVGAAQTALPPRADVRSA